LYHPTLSFVYLFGGYRKGDFPWQSVSLPGIVWVCAAAAHCDGETRPAVPLSFAAKINGVNAWFMVLVKAWHR